MEPEWVAVWVAIGALVVSAVAAVATAVSLGYIRGQRDATVRQADAAEAQVVVMRRQVELMEQQAESGAFTGGAPYVPPWSLRYAGGDAYTLVNGGSETAFDVRVEVPERAAKAGTYEWPRVDPMSTVKFFVVFTLATVGSAVTVRWRRSEDGDELAWTSELPVGR